MSAGEDKTCVQYGGALPLWFEVLGPDSRFQYILQYGVDQTIERDVSSYLLNMNDPMIAHELTVSDINPYIKAKNTGGTLYWTKNTRLRAMEYYNLNDYICREVPLRRVLKSDV